MADTERALALLRQWRRLPAKDLLEKLGVSRPTLMRLVRELDDRIVARGRARRTAYAARRPLRGDISSIPLYRITETGYGEQVGELEPTYPQGSAARYDTPLGWPLDGLMEDGWFEGLPYMLDDMRPQGFLGRAFARRYGKVLQVPEDPSSWSEDDVLYALTVMGSDAPGNMILGTTAYRLYLDEVQSDPDFPERDIEGLYLARATEAMADGQGTSSAAGEFPKFTARRILGGEPIHVIVKFSGDDDAPGTRRWSDLLVCEHLALETLVNELGIAAAASQILQASGRTFLEVVRFDRHGKFGRSAVCTWEALNAALPGLSGTAWVPGAAKLHELDLLSAPAARTVASIWQFGRLIANTDMLDGNLAFRPGLELAPVYDMLPMLYAPQRGVELPARQFVPPLPLPSEVEVWRDAARAAERFWARAAGDNRVSADFRLRCEENARALKATRAHPLAAG